jgi:hypothetical protein
MGTGNCAFARPSAVELVASMLLFDHLVVAGKQRRRQGKPEYPGCLGVDDQLELRRQLNCELGDDLRAVTF